MKLANLDRLLGEGNFHWVYSLRDNHQLAVKIAKQRNGQMGREVKVLSALEYSNLFPKEFGTISLSGIEGTQQRQQADYVVMEKLGISLSELMNHRKGKLGVSLIKKIGTYLHSIGVVHNDIKPGNILFGREENRHQVYIIDFGLAKMPDEETQCQSDQGRIFRGNVSFASINSLRGEQSQALDDIESLCYVLLWMLAQGQYPWKSFNLSFRGQNCHCQSCPSCFQSQVSFELTSKSFFLKDSLQWMGDEKGKLSKKLHQLLRTLHNCPPNASSTYSFALSACESILMDL